MKLLTLLRCDIYRDRGSLEGIWQTDTGDRWAITLAINPWDHPEELKTYRLFNSGIGEAGRAAQIRKDSPEHRQVMALIDTWLFESRLTPESQEPERSSDNRLRDLRHELRQGNF